MFKIWQALAGGKMSQEAGRNVGIATFWLIFWLMAITAIHMWRL